MRLQYSHIYCTHRILSISSCSCFRMNEFTAMFTPLEWHVQDITDSIYQCFTNPSLIEFISHFGEIKAKHFEIPPTIQHWHKLLNDCLGQPVEFYNFTTSQNMIQCHFKFWHSVQQITLFTCNLLDDKEQDKLSTKLRNLHFSYDITTNILYFHVNPLNIQFKWNASQGFYAGPNGLEYRHFLRDFPPPDFGLDRSLSQNTTSNIFVVQPSSQASNAPGCNVPTMTTSSGFGFSPGMFYGSSNTDKQALEARMYASVASNNIKLLKNELTVTFDPSKLATRFNTVKTPTNHDLTQLILAVTGCIEPTLNIPNSTTKESAVDSDSNIHVDSDMSNDNVGELSGGKKTD